MPILRASVKPENSRNSHRGVFFDVRSGGAPVRITALTGGAYGGDRPVTVYAREEGSGAGRETKRGSWREVGAGDWKQDQSTRLVLSSPVSVRAGATVGVYVHTTDGSDGVQYTQPRKQGAVDSSDGAIALLCGRYTIMRDHFGPPVNGDGYVPAGSVEYEVLSNGLETTARSVVAVPPPSLGASLRQLLDTGMLSDVALKAADDLSAVAAHKSILAIRSPVFAAMFSSAMVEASSSEVALEGVSGPVLRSLLHFLYTDQLADAVADDPVQIEGLLAAADRYACPRLLALCEQRLCATVTEESAVGLLVLSERHHAAQLKEYCLEFISQRPAEVMATQGWQQLGTHPNLLQELFAQSSGIRKRPRDAAEDEASDKGALTREQVRGMKVSELRAACVKRGLESTGLKAALVARLEALLD